MLGGLSKSASQRASIIKPSMACFGVSWGILTRFARSTEYTRGLPRRLLIAAYRKDSMSEVPSCAKPHA